ncbi:MAG: hypothetical protein B7Z37_18355 [Verrucomicrobia bacterium 12-59-8]|nr:MAG: hypothetical protein B7Z37_18355 [Verrucomicrobia bacterium 12-59-8]
MVRAKVRAKQHPVLGNPLAPGKTAAHHADHDSPDESALSQLNNFTHTPCSKNYPAQGTP